MNYQVKTSIQAYYSEGKCVNVNRPLVKGSDGKCCPKNLTNDCFSQFADGSILCFNYDKSSFHRVIDKISTEILGNQE